MPRTTNIGSGPANGHARFGGRGTRTNSKLSAGHRIIPGKKLDALLVADAERKRRQAEEEARREVEQHVLIRSFEAVWQRTRAVLGY